MSEVKQDAPAVKESEANTEKTEVETLEVEEVESKEVVDKSEQIAKDQKRRAEKAEAQAESLQAEIAKLRNEAMSGSKSMLDVNSDLKALASEYNVDETFISKLVQTVRATTTKEIKAELEKDLTPKIAKLEQQTQIKKMEERFEELYAKELKKNPEYEGIAKKSIIKERAFNEIRDGKKTLSTIGQLLEDTYGEALQGKKSIETTHASRESLTPDLNNPSDEDMAKINADPKLKDEWSKNIQKQIQDYL